MGRKDAHRPKNSARWPARGCGTAWLLSRIFPSARPSPKQPFPGLYHHSVSILLGKRQLRLTFSRPDCPSEPGLIPFFLGDAVRSVMVARFLRLFSRHGRSLSPSTSGADRSLPVAFPSFRIARSSSPSPRGCGSSSSSTAVSSPARKEWDFSTMLNSPPRPCRKGNPYPLAISRAPGWQPVSSVRPCELRNDPTSCG